MNKDEREEEYENWVCVWCVWSEKNRGFKIFSFPALVVKLLGEDNEIRWTGPDEIPNLVICVWLWNAEV